MCVEKADNISPFISGMYEGQSVTEVPLRNGIRTKLVSAIHEKIKACTILEFL